MAKSVRCTTILILAFGITSLIEGGMASEALQVLANDSAVISCFPNRVLKVQWHHTPLGKSSSAYVYAGGRFYFPYNTGRFSTYNDSTTNTYTFVITNVTREDAGLYECKDDEKSGVFGSTQLIVLDSSPVCNSNMHPDGFIGPNKCNLQKENMTFSCSVSFSGKTPSLMWRSFNDNQSLIDKDCATKPNHINCSFTLEADPEYDGTVFICETKSLNGARFNCSTEVIKVQHFSADNETSARKVRDNVSCIVTSNLETRYNWTREQNGQYVFLSSERTIVMQKPGIYLCHVEYSIRNNTCSFLTSVVNASEATDSSGSQKDQSTNAATIAALVVLSSIVIIILIAVIIVLVVRKRRGKNRITEHDSEEVVTIPLIAVPTQPGDAYKPQPPVKEPEIKIPENNDDIKSKIEAQREKLVDIVESEFELLPELLRNGTLTSDEMGKVKAEQTNADKNTMLLGCILQNAKHREFLEALQNVGQIHVVNWIKASGIYKPEYDLQWPLSGKEVEYINRNYIGEVLSTESDFVEMLLANEAINDKQKDFINAKTNKFERNEAFLDILRRFSLKAYFLVTKCLRESKQESIARILEDGGAIVPLHANLEGQNTKEKEDKLVELLKADLQKTKTIEINGYFIVDARQGNSIVLFTCCHKSEEFYQLCSEVAGDRVRDIVGQLFNRLLQDSESQITDVQSVTINDKDKDNIKSSFEREEARDKKFDVEIRKLRVKLQNESGNKKPPSKSDSNGQSPDTPAEDTNPTPEKKDKKENVTEITESNWSKILQSNYADLLVKIDSNSEGGLAGEFRKLGCFTSLQIKNIWGHRSSVERNKAILSLLERGDLKRFMAVRSALSLSGQQPVVDMHLSLIKEQLPKPDDRYKEPLKGSHRYQLLVNWNKLLDDINDEDGLIIRINERGTLTNYQKAVLADLPHGPSKLNYLLRLLETGSQQHFNDFCECLEDNHQGHIVNDYLTPRSINRKLDDIPTSFKDMPLRFSIKDKPITGRVLVISNRSYLDQNRSEMHVNETNLNIFFEQKLVYRQKPIFDQKLVRNETTQELMKTLKAEQQNPKDFDVFLVFLFSYGNSREIFTTDGQSFKIDDLFDMFDDENYPKLKGKPKLFIIQTFERDGALDSPSLDAEGKLSANFNLKADMAVLYATVKGEPKDGREVTGTLFTTCLLEVFFSKIEADFKEIIEKVLVLLRERDQTITLPKGEVQTVQQLATFKTTLTEKVFLVEQR